MTMDISNQNKLAEFYEELKRTKTNIVRPDINKCFADFRADKDSFYYALGGIKNVGFEAVSNIVKERLKNGEFKSINDLINRVNPKDINKLQLEGMVKAGAFDKLSENRKGVFNSIPNIILKSKNIFENKVANQIDLFGSTESQDIEIIEKISDWKFEERLKKEFESIGFFISDHPLNQFKDIFDDYNIVNFQDFNNEKNNNEANIAGTILKIQEKKTQKGNSYAIIKLTDLSSVFELFIFSDLLELNREILNDGDSLILTVNKNVSDETNRFKRINVKKITSLKNLFDKPISNIEIFIKDRNSIHKIEEILSRNGNTEVKIKIKDEKNKYIINLKNKRLVDRKSLNLLKNQGISTNIF